MWACFYLLIYLLFWDRVSSSPSWPWARSVDKNALELLIPLFPPLKCWYDSRHSYAGCGCILQSTDIYFWSFPPPWRAGISSWFLIPGGHLLPWVPQHLKPLQMFFLHLVEFQVGSRHAMAGMICHPSSWGLLDFTWNPCTESPSATWWGWSKHILHIIYWVLRLCWSGDNAHHLQRALLFLVDATCRGFDTNLLCSRYLETGGDQCEGTSGFCFCTWESLLVAQADFDHVLILLL